MLPVHLLLCLDGVLLILKVDKGVLAVVEHAHALQLAEFLEDFLEGLASSFSLQTANKQVATWRVVAGRTARRSAVSPPKVTTEISWTATAAMVVVDERTAVPVAATLWRVKESAELAAPRPITWTVPEVSASVVKARAAAHRTATVTPETIRRTTEVIAVMETTWAVEPPWRPIKSPARAVKPRAGSPHVRPIEPTAIRRHVHHSASGTTHGSAAHGTTRRHAAHHVPRPIHAHGRAATGRGGSAHGRPHAAPIEHAVIFAQGVEERSARAKERAAGGGAAGRRRRGVAAPAEQREEGGECRRSIVGGLLRRAPATEACEHSCEVEATAPTTTAAATTASSKECQKVVGRRLARSRARCGCGRWRGT
mmetsp:Transcript_32847/g.75114  ORF Transcript_32847/g.75114 Transcript_32847/m.75114 type:complete len:368 (+) Transcript_32847:284-1387(+)